MPAEPPMFPRPPELEGLESEESHASTTTNNAASEMRVSRLNRAYFIENVVMKSPLQVAPHSTQWRLSLRPVEESANLVPRRNLDDRSPIGRAAKNLIFSLTEVGPPCHCV